MNQLKPAEIFLLILAVYSQNTYAFNTQTLNTFGMESLRGIAGPSFESDISVAFFDGSSTIDPPNTTTLDRRIDSNANMSVNGEIAGNLSTFFSLEYAGSFQKTEEQSELLNPSLTKKNDLQSDLGIGIQGRLAHFILGLRTKYLFGESSESDALGVRTHIEKGEGFLYAPAMALCKQTSGWQASIYYLQAAERDRSYAKSVYGIESSKGKTKIGSPQEIGLSAAFEYQSFEISLDLASVEAGKVGEKSDSGARANDNYLRFVTTSLLHLDSTNALGIGFGHQTLAYSVSAYTTFENIPTSSLHLDYIMGAKEQHAKIGLIFGLAKDEASITEYNREFKMTAVGLSTGWSSSF